MSRFNYKHGDWNAICDRCGFQYKASELRGEWTGLMVCSECWEPRHPQEFIRGVPDDPSVPWTRTQDYTDPQGITYHGDESAVLSARNSNTGRRNNTIVHIWNEALTEDRVVNLYPSKLYAKKGDRFIIYKTVDDGKTLYVTGQRWDGGISV